MENHAQRSFAPGKRVQMFLNITGGLAALKASLFQVDQESLCPGIGSLQDGDQLISTSVRDTSDTSDLFVFDTVKGGGVPHPSHRQSRN
jgi:hypothetical protein